MIGNQENTIPLMLLLSFKPNRTKCSLLVRVLVVLEDSNCLSGRSPCKTALRIIRFTQKKTSPLEAGRSLYCCPAKISHVWPPKISKRSKKMLRWIQKAGLNLIRLSSQKWNEMEWNVYKWRMIVISDFFQHMISEFIGISPTRAFGFSRDFQVESRSRGFLYLKLNQQDNRVAKCIPNAKKRLCMLILCVLLHSFT